MAGVQTQIQNYYKLLKPAWTPTISSEHLSNLSIIACCVYRILEVRRSGTQSSEERIAASGLHISVMALFSLRVVPMAVSVRLAWCKTKKWRVQATQVLFYFEASQY